MMDSYYQSWDKVHCQDLLSYRLVIDGGNNFSFRLGNAPMNWLNYFECDTHVQEGTGMKEIVHTIESIDPRPYNNYGDFSPFSENLGASLRDKMLQLLNDPIIQRDNFRHGYLVTPLMVTYLASRISITPQLTCTGYAIEVALRAKNQPGMWDNPVPVDEDNWYHTGY